MKFYPLLLALGATLQLAPSLSAQGIPFQLFIQDANSNTTAVASGSNITLSSTALNKPVTVTFIARYVGTGTATTGQPQLFGSPEFSFAPVHMPAVLNPGDSLSVNITFTPTSTAQASGQFLIPYSELDAKGNPLSTGSLGLNLTGTTPNFAVTYAFPSDQNVVQLSDGDTLPFPPTALPGSSVVTIAIQNLGSGPGPINSVKVTGAAFQVQGLPLLPASLNASTALQFTIRYTPTQSSAPDLGTLQVVFADHTVNVKLTGTGTAPAFTYQLVQKGQSTTLTTGQSVDLPAVAVGMTVNFSVTVQNTGTGTGTINSAGIIGQGYQITAGPQFPQTVAPNSFITLSFSFTPPQAGAFKAQLRIGTDSFTLNGVGTGSQLMYSYSTSGGVTNVVPNGIVLFSPVQVSQSSSTVFTVQNTGTAPATVISITIQQNKSAFTLSGLPNVPLTLAPNGSASFTIVFSPTVTGPNNATLAIDTQTFTLSGAGTAPPSLPAFQFAGPSGVQQPLQQPAVGLALAAPYPLAISGTLTIAETPDGFSPDPAVQFATGGLVVAFTIPANTLQAVFPNGATTVKLQTGSVAGTITITPSFSTAGGYDLTPTSPTNIQLTVPPLAPQLISVQVTASSPNGLTLQLTGVATSRKLTKLDFTFTSTMNFILAATKVSVDITSVAATWFQNAQSTPFGGQFAISIPFGLSSSTTGGTAAGALQSVAAAIENDIGTSNTVTAALQ